MKVTLDHVEYVAHMIYIVSVELVTKTKIIVFGLLKRGRQGIYPNST